MNNSATHTSLEKAFVAFKGEVSEQKNIFKRKVDVCDHPKDSFLKSLTEDFVEKNKEKVLEEIRNIEESAKAERLYDFPSDLEQLINKIENPDEAKKSLKEFILAAQESADASKDSMEYPLSNCQVTEEFLEGKTIADFANAETLGELRENGGYASSNDANELSEMVDAFADRLEAHHAEGLSA